MNLQFYLEKLQNSDVFRNFIEKNPTAFLCSGFFVIDKEGNDNKQHFDFFVPEIKKTFSFQFNQNIEKVELESFNDKFPEKVSEEAEFNFDFIEKLIVGEMFEKKISNKIQKILLSLQKLNGKDFLVGTVFISGLGLLKVNIDLVEKKVVDFEKKSFFDFVRKVK